MDRPPAPVPPKTQRPLLLGVVIGIFFISCADSDRPRPVPSSTTGAVVPVAPSKGDLENTANALAVFARAPSAARHAALNLATTVHLALGAKTLRTIDGAGLVDPGAWFLDLEGFEGYLGPFSALDALARPGPHDVTAGSHSRCATPPTATPPEVDGFQQIAIQPRTTESCIQWFAVDLFLDHAGAIAMVRLDLFGP